MKRIPVLAALSLTACVTINIYFPAAAAEKAADEIIKDIQDAVPGQTVPKPKPKAALENWQLATYQAIDRAVALLINTAEAAEADLSIDSPEIRQLTASMESRFSTLQGFYASGAIGIKSDGLLAVKDPAAVALQDRNQVTKLVAAENKDRQALYQAIANANGHPEWAAQIKATFAARWVSNAQAGWWYQSSGTWKQK